MFVVFASGASDCSEALSVVRKSIVVGKLLLSFVLCCRSLWHCFVLNVVESDVGIVEGALMHEGCRIVAQLGVDSCCSVQVSTCSFDCTP